MQYYAQTWLGWVDEHVAGPGTGVGIGQSPLDRKDKLIPWVCVPFSQDKSVPSWVEGIQNSYLSPSGCLVSSRASVTGGSELVPVLAGWLFSSSSLGTGTPPKHSLHPGHQAASIPCQLFRHWGGWYHRLTSSGWVILSGWLVTDSSEVDTALQALTWNGKKIFTLRFGIFN